MNFTGYLIKGGRWGGGGCAYSSGALQVNAISEGASLGSCGFTIYIPMHLYG